MVRGGRSLMLAPLANVAAVSMASSWPSPSFGGGLLPDRHRIDGGGFTAQWEVSAFGRNLPRTWDDCEVGPAQARDRIDRQAFGVTLATPVDVYQQAERSTKYGALFIVLTFLAFFIVETLRRVPVHPVQYLMVGAALCVFYLLLLSLSEHVGFTAAYVLASSATVGLIGAYARSALRSGPPAWTTTALLTALYACLYVLLQLEDYALMTGSLVVFAVLGTVMFVTRRINWYDVAAVGGPTQA